MRYILPLAAALACSACGHLLREPFCSGAKSYEGMARREIAGLPAALRSDVQARSGVTLETWYESHDAAVVIAVVADRGDHAFSYMKTDTAYTFVNEEEVPCLEE
jgi:hypothetical protein